MANTDLPPLCAKGCGFYGSSETKNILLEKNSFSKLFTLVSCNWSNSPEFTNFVFRKSIDLVSLNLFRALPHSCTDSAATIQFGESFYIKRNNRIDDDDAFQDPSWPELDLVYRFLLSLLKSPQFPSPYIKPSFILKLLDLFQSEDPRERDALVSVLQVIYQKFGVLRKFIRKSIFKVFCCSANGKHKGIRHLLLLLRSVFIEEEDDDDLGIREELKLFLVRALIPLYKSQRLALFYKHLNSCIEKLVEKDCKLAGTVMQGMIKHWPTVGSAREFFFLDGVESVLMETQPDEFQVFMIPLFRRIASSLSSSHSKVAEKGLSLFYIDGNIRNLIKQNLDFILPIIFTDLEESAKTHWRPETQKLARYVWNSLVDIDPELFKECWMQMKS